MTGSRAYALEFVGGHAGAGATAANEQGALGTAAAQGFGHGTGVVGVIDGVGGICSEVQDLVSEAPHLVHHTVLERKSGMVRRDSNFHEDKCFIITQALQSVGTADGEKKTILYRQDIKKEASLCIGPSGSLHSG